MVDNHDLERLCAALDSGPTDLRATEPLLALRRLLLLLLSPSRRRSIRARGKNACA